MAATIGHLLAAYAIAALMLAIGLQTDRAIVRDLAARAGLVARALAVAWIGVPVLALIVVSLVRTEPLATLAIVVMAICPGVPLVVRKTRKAGGDPELSLAVLIATALSAIVMVPLWVEILDRVTPIHLAIDRAGVAAILLPKVLLPFAIGRVVNHVAPRVAAALARVALGVFVAGLVVLVIAVVPRALPLLARAHAPGIAALALVTLGAAALGYLAGGKRHDHRISFAYAAALGNPALAIALLAPTVQARAVALVVAYVALRAIALVPFGIWLKRQRHGGASPRTAAGVAHAHGR
jgi:BASS family bile acid:Na+ symporter